MDNLKRAKNNLELALQELKILNNKGNELLSDYVFEAYAEIKNAAALGDVTKGFNSTELRHILNKCELVKIKPDFKEILFDKFGDIEYTGEESETFFDKYAGKTVNVYEWKGDWWICEDDNFVITQECFELVDNNS